MFEGDFRKFSTGVEFFEGGGEGAYTSSLPAGSKELRISNNVMVYDNLSGSVRLAGKHSLLPVDHENYRREIH